MSIVYPATLDDFTNPVATQTLVAAGGNGVAGQLSDLNDAVEALEAKVGVNTSAVATSIDYLLKNTSAGHDHDGTDSKKVLVTNLDITGLTANNYLRINSGGTAVESYDSGDFDLPAATSNITVDGSDVLRSRFVLATEMASATTSPAASGQIESSTQAVNVPVWDFDQTSVEYVAWAWSPPKNWNLGAVYITLYWAAATAGGVRWNVQGIAESDLGAFDTAYGSAGAATDTSDATLRTLITETMTVTIGGTPAAGDMVYFRISRQPAHADDTMAADARMIGIKINYTVGQFTDPT